MENMVPFGDFSFIENNNQRNMIEDAYNAVSNTVDGWEFMKTFNPKNGFMYTDNPKLSEISHKMNMQHDHSGGSYAWTMRQIEYIAKKGWINYVELWHNINNAD